MLQRGPGTRAEQVGGRCQNMVVHFHQMPGVVLKGVGLRGGSRKLVSFGKSGRSSARHRGRGTAVGSVLSHPVALLQVLLIEKKTWLGGPLASCGLREEHMCRGRLAGIVSDLHTNAKYQWNVILIHRLFPCCSVRGMNDLCRRMRQGP